MNTALNGCGRSVSDFALAFLLHKTQISVLMYYVTQRENGFCQSVTSKRNDLIHQRAVNDYTNAFQPTIATQILCSITTQNVTESNFQSYY